jgi:hypothetical protein
MNISQFIESTEAMRQAHILGTLSAANVQHGIEALVLLFCAQPDAAKVDTIDSNPRLIVKPDAGLTVQQIAWAEQHDWFRWPHVSAGVSGVVVIERQSGGHSERKWFGDFQALRAWAGY